MRLTSIVRSAEFGKLAKIRGIVYYRLSPYEQKAFAGTIDPGIPNTIRRIRENIFRVVPPFIITYLIFSWTKNEHERFVRKKPGDFADDE